MKKRHSAFTLIELLLVVAVIAFVAYVTIPGYISSQNKQKMTNNAKDVLRLMTEARNRAIAGLAIDGEEGGDSYIDPEETILPQAFGVGLVESTDLDEEPSRAFLFAYQGGGEETNNWQFDPDRDTILEEIEFAYAVKILDLQALEKGNDVPYNPVEAQVFYRVPLGDTLINVKSPEGNWLADENITDVQWLRTDLALWQMANVDGEINDQAFVRSVVAHSVSNYSYMCSSIKTYNDDSTACDRNPE